MPEQLVLDLPVRPAMGRGDFFVSESNAGAVVLIEAWGDWPHGKLVLTGPEGSGKTHLAHVWAALAGARIVAAADIAEDDLPRLAHARALVVEDLPDIAGDRAAETLLFHLHNALAGSGAPLLVTARAKPSRWGLGLPDLDSRMRQAGLAHLDPPDDALLAALLVKLCHDRALRLTPAILSHVVARVERASSAIQAFVDRLDARALAHKRPPRLSDAKAVLAEFEADVSRFRHET
ncbi:DnaA/Hda family protein [Roseibacterium sp. SDUM158017]|uniref:DnaA ATPase domain-containing protein n=1 Tax=Roseicyclus salinarum TaxID=3036773 RepID=UPI00241546DB|nr:DnaA/Hda family protein [Roseibacterium sp. SDUM158017]MDG4650488.1 DnaA/Hda family protein [Roseibacterium sp. SDUM158017]